jgi:hypothetical protein
MAASPVSYSVSAAREMNSAVTGSPPACPNGVTLLANVAAVNTRTATGAETAEPRTPSTVRSESPQEIIQRVATPTTAARTGGSARESASTIRPTPTNPTRRPRTTSAAPKPTSVVRQSTSMSPPGGPAA